MSEQQGQWTHPSECGAYELRLVGGLRFLWDDNVSINIEGHQVVDWKFNQHRNRLILRLRVIQEGPLDIERLERAGFEVKTGYSVGCEDKYGRFAGLMEGWAASLTFTWRRWRGFYYPSHWLDAGVERCIAMHRILGPDETKWPEVALVG